MKMVELHGKAPYKTVLVHGGPGAQVLKKLCRRIKQTKQIMKCITEFGMRLSD